MLKILLVNCYILVASIQPEVVLPLHENESLILLKTAQVEVSLESQEVLDLFIAAVYEEESESLLLETHENIHSILIYNSDEELEFMLPVMSTSVTLGRSMFDTGNYRLGFNFQNIEDLTFADLAMK